VIIGRNVYMAMSLKVCSKKKYPDRKCDSMGAWYQIPRSFCFYCSDNQANGQVGDEKMGQH
jgi:hypothetical protein